MDRVEVEVDVEVHVDVPTPYMSLQLTRFGGSQIYRVWKASSEAKPWHYFTAASAPALTRWARWWRGAVAPPPNWHPGISYPGGCMGGDWPKAGTLVHHHHHYRRRPSGKRGWVRTRSLGQSNSALQDVKND
jgi:hypothetical protein